MTKARLERGQVTPPSSALLYTHAQSDSSQQPPRHTKPQLTGLWEGRGLTEQLAAGHSEAPVSGGPPSCA